MARSTAKKNARRSPAAPKRYIAATAAVEEEEEEEEEELLLQTQLQPTIEEDSDTLNNNNDVPASNNDDPPPPQRPMMTDVSSNAKRGRPRGSTKKPPSPSSTTAVDHTPQVARAAASSSQSHLSEEATESNLRPEDDNDDTMMEDNRKPAARPSQPKKKKKVSMPPPPPPFAWRSNTSAFESVQEEGDDGQHPEDEMVQDNVDRTENSAFTAVVRQPTAKARTTSNVDREDDAVDRRGSTTPKKKKKSSAVTFPPSTPTPQEIDSRCQQRLDSLYLDMIEYEQEVIMNSRADRKSHWKVLEHLLEQYTHSAAVYGRVFVRTQLCMLLYDACSEPGYSDTSLLGYNKNEWQELIEDLENTRTICLQQDCTAVLPYDGPNPTKDETRNNHKAFTNDYKIVSVACTINRKLAPIRKSLEAQIEAAGENGPVQLKSKKIVALLNSIDDDEEDVVKHYIYSLFEHDEDDEDNADDNSKEVAPFQLDVPTKPILKDLASLRDILHAKPFDLRWLQTKLETLVSSWNHECFGEVPPNLVILGYDQAEDWVTMGSPKSKQPRRRGSMKTNRMSRQTTSKNGQLRQMEALVPASLEGRVQFGKEIETLKRTREALRDNHGDDPLETSREIAEQVTGIPRTRTVMSPSARARKVARINHVGTAASATASHPNTQDDDVDEVLEDVITPPRRRDTTNESDRRRALREKDMNEVSAPVDDDDMENDGNDDQPSRAYLSTVPPRARHVITSTAAASSSPLKLSTYIGPPPDEGIYDARGNVLQRRGWLDIEVDALVAGLKKYGVGKWVLIKNEYGQILRNRTSMQLKDKYRTMERRGELSIE